MSMTCALRAWYLNWSISGALLRSSVRHTYTYTHMRAMFSYTGFAHYRVQTPSSFGYSVFIDSTCCLQAASYYARFGQAYTSEHVLKCSMANREVDWAASQWFDGIQVR